VRVVVEDNYAEGDLDADKKPIPNRTSSETFTFVVIPDQELVSSILARENALTPAVDKAVTTVRKAMDDVGRINLQLTGSVTEGEINNFRLQMMEAQDSLEGTHEDVRKLTNEYAKVLRESRVNQLPTEHLQRVYGRIYKKLQAASDFEYRTTDTGGREKADSQFEASLKEVRDLRSILDDEKTAASERAKLGRVFSDPARAKLEKLEKNLSEVLSTMQGLQTLKKLVDELIRIRNRQNESKERIRKLEEELKLKYAKD
jgi:hypothetical protein